MGRNLKVTVSQIQEMNKLYDNGQTMNEIGDELNLGHSTINRYIWHPRHRGESMKAIDHRKEEVHYKILNHNQMGW